MHDLGEPGSGQSCALAVNNEGVVAGRSDTGEIVIWRAAGVTHLGVKGRRRRDRQLRRRGGIDPEGSTTTAFKYQNGW
jgi:hypothetical protein